MQTLIKEKNGKKYYILSIEDEQDRSVISNIVLTGITYIFQNLGKCKRGNALNKVLDGSGFYIVKDTDGDVAFEQEVSEIVFEAARCAAIEVIKAEQDEATKKGLLGNVGFIKNIQDNFKELDQIG